MRSPGIIALAVLTLRAIAAAAPAPEAPAAPAREASFADAGPDRASAASGGRPSGAAERTGTGSAEHVPPIGAVLHAAYVAAGFDHDPQVSWIRRARLSGLIPWVTVRTTRETSWQDQQSEVGHGASLELRATWRLDRLLFDAKELQVASIESARRRERRRLASRVIRAYFAWRRALSATGPDAEHAADRAAEAAAELDALTDGWFSDELARSPPDPGGAPDSAKHGNREG